MITRPVRERPADQVRTMVQDGLRRTGYDEVALTSLSTADFSGIDGLVAGLVNEQQGCGNVGLSLPSLRVDAFTVGIASEIQKIRRTGLTFAPEGGTWRVRQVINKLITDDDLYAAVEGAYSQGWQRVKLYFLIGVPTEMDEDTLGIAELAREVVKIGRKYTKKASATASVGGFVPKAHTPFQWFGQNSVAGAPPQGRAAARRSEALGRAASGGTIPRRRTPKGSRAAATGGSAGSSSACGAPAARSRSGASASSSTAGSTRWPPRGSTPTGTSPGTAPRTRSSPGTTSPPGCTATSSGTTGRRRWPSPRAPRLPVDPVLRLRGVHRLRPRARRGVGGAAGGWQPGHRPGSRLRPGGSRRADHQGRQRGARVRGDSGFPVRIRFAKRGKVRFVSAPRRRPRRSSARSGSSNCRSRSPRGSRPDPR